jgi:hypothetical protein
VNDQLEKILKEAVVACFKVFLQQLALCYKPEGRGFDSRRGHWIFKLT